MIILNIPEALIYTIVGISVPMIVSIIWSLIALYFSHSEQKKKLERHIETAEKDRQEFTLLRMEVSKLNGNFEMLLKKIEI